MAPNDAQENGPRRVLAVSSGGGHLAEMYEIAPRVAGDHAELHWVTSERWQGRSLLKDVEHAWFLRPVTPRAVRTMLANVPDARRILRAGRYDAVLGSGAMALSFLPLARAMGIGAHWIESITRTEGPSVTGRLLSRVPGTRLYTQHESWAGGRWHYAGTVLDAFEATEPVEAPPLRRVVVTVGMNPYPFRRLFERLLEILPADAEILWQTGTTDVSGLPLEPRAQMPVDELSAAIAAADVVIAHAGAGSAIDALQHGRIPLLVPRRASHGEQVDDHQFELVDDLVARGLAVGVGVEELDLDVIRRAAALRARRRSPLPPFELA